MKALVIAAVLSLCGLCTAIAAPFLVSDPYPLTGVQPASFSVQLDSTAPASVPVTVNADGTRQLRYDVGPLGISNGQHTFTVKASAPSGVSAQTNFPFTWPLSPPVPPPASPVNLRLTPQ